MLTVTNSGESSSKEVKAPYESSKLKEKLAAHKVEKTTKWFKIKKFFKK